MITVLFNITDCFYQQGLKYLPRPLIEGLSEEPVVFIEGMTADKIESADIIIISLRKGEERLCNPLLGGQNNGILFAITEEETLFSLPLPECYRNIIFLSCYSRKEEWHTKLSARWHTVKGHGKANCRACQQQTFSPQQLRVMSGVFDGKSAGQIATELNIKEKTVWSHKYQAMRSLGLRSNRDLHGFLRIFFDQTANPYQVVNPKRDLSRAVTQLYATALDINQTSRCGGSFGDPIALIF